MDWLDSGGAVVTRSANRRPRLSEDNHSERKLTARVQEIAGVQMPAQQDKPTDRLVAAVAGFDHESARALTGSGADADRELPDGTTPLLRAVDLGSDAMVSAVLPENPKLLPEKARKRLLDLARHWFETGEEEELRRRTGAPGPAARCLVNDDTYSMVEEVSLGGLTVRAGHSAILTTLEEWSGIVSPVAELVARAVPFHAPDESNINWTNASSALGRRRSPQDWSDLQTLRHHPDPVHRRLLADVVWQRNLLTWWDSRQDTGDDAEFLATWALDELVTRSGYSKTRISELLRGKGYYPGWEITYSVVRALDIPIWPLRRLWTAAAREADKDNLWIESRIREVQPLQPEQPPLAHQGFTEAMREAYTDYARAFLLRDHRAQWVVAEVFDLLWLGWDEAIASPDVRRHAWRLLRSRVMLRVDHHTDGHPDLRAAAFSTVAQSRIDDLTARHVEIGEVGDLFDLIGRLPQDQLDITVLRYLCGISPAAIPTIIGLSPALTHAMDHHARGALEGTHHHDNPGVINP